jgi:hypothetical protein
MGVIRLQIRDVEEPEQTLKEALSALVVNYQVNYQTVVSDGRRGKMALIDCTAHRL